MKTAGVIAEYNPFHNGHKYQLDAIRQRTGADRIAIFMSGSFVQRGTAAVADKYTRAEMALQGGADLVIELPVIYSTGSAELFALGGLTSMKAAGIVSFLCFGAETDNLAALSELSGILADEPDDYRNVLQAALKGGSSFPAAREQALLQLAGGFSPSLLHELVSSSNNILALEYLKACRRIHFSAEPVLIPRIGGDYRESALTGSYSSATAIRGLLSAAPDRAFSPALREKLAEVLPAESLSLLEEASRRGSLVSEHDLSAPLFYALLDQKYHASAAYKEGKNLPADCDSGLFRRTMDAVSDFDDFNSFAASLKSKNYTYTHICRVLLHILLGLTENDRQAALSGVPYLRVLGFRRSSADLLKELQEHAGVPVITRPSEYTRLLDLQGQACFEKDLFASELYSHLSSGGSQKIYKNDFDHPMVILP